MREIKEGQVWFSQCRGCEDIICVVVLAPHPLCEDLNGYPMGRYYCDEDEYLYPILPSCAEKRYEAGQLTYLGEL